MNEVLSIFIIGIGGVFAGMALLYLTIRIVAYLIDTVKADREVS